MSNKPNYKTSRKYKCPYCDIKATRGELVDHVEKHHSELIPEGYTAARAIYDSINGKNYGICMTCKKPVYKWNDKINRYYNLCDNTSCRAKVRETALNRHMKVYNKPTLLNDPEQQEKMLANRRISGTYIYSDGKKFVYTGKYEKNALEFMDKVLEIPSSDIITPGPVLEYEYDGKPHKWITDILYVPGNLIIEIKDGGSNPNNRSMQSYRDKQIAKEVMITDKGEYNYIRLTNNDFSQLLDIFADMKIEALNEKNPKTKVHINESLLIERKLQMNMTIVKSAVKRISSNGNSNNCQLCAGCFELAMRGIQKSPRGVNTPRDIVFKSDSNWSFIKNGKKINLRNDIKTHAKEIVSNAGSGSRFYCHNGWKGSTGGHVFNIINIDDDIYIIDAQAGKIIPIDSDNHYLNSNKVDYTRCYLIRADNKELNIDKIAYNDLEYAIPWKDGDEKYLEVTINEEVGGLPPHRPPEAYIVPYGMNTVFDGFGYSDSEMDSIVISDFDGTLTNVNESEFFDKYITGPILYYTGNDISEKISDIHKCIKEGKVDNRYYLVEVLAGFKMLKPTDIVLSEYFKYYDADTEAIVCNLMENALKIKPIDTDSNIVKTIGNVFIHLSPNGYYATTPSDFYLASDYFNSYDDIERSDVVSLMNNVYASNSTTKGEIYDV